MPGTKRQAEALVPEDSKKGSAKRRHGAQLADVQLGGFDSLPYEIRLAVVREIAYQPNRRDARDELANLLEVSKHVNGLILDDKALKESVAALQRNPNIESRYIAVCRDVVHGIPVEDALRQNGPLPKREEVRASEVDDALEDATPEHLANLADAFSARRGPAFKEALTGVAWAATGDGPGRLNSAHIGSLTTLAGAFTNIHLDLEDRDLKAANEAVAMQVAVRGDDLLPHANIEQIATLTSAFAGHDDSEFEDAKNFNDAMDKLASQVTARGDELLPKASAEQLGTMRDMFGGPEVQLAPSGAAFNWPAEADYPVAFAKVVKEMGNRDEAKRLAHDTQRRLQLANRDRSRDCAVER
ncbi:hypothetical protein HFN63_34370 [Rhizobium leguminosarum]|uniref:hypothetical protein n=1 Tax=Rhizobium leguminosarum TaxID=384 RepID=UPI001C988B48|nr:hypothetical protein [Rhizobium leguminosarum]MBY5775076.1 hypothetical protein [Rhizobium leguminosarum]